MKNLLNVKEVQLIIGAGGIYYSYIKYGLLQEKMYFSSQQIQDLVLVIRPQGKCKLQELLRSHYFPGSSLLFVELCS